MTITTQNQAPLLRVSLEGDIDERGAEELKKQFQCLPLAGIKTVELDFGKVIHIGSSGIGKLLVLYRNLAIRDIQLRVVNVVDHIYDLMVEMKLDGVFSLEAQSASLPIK